MATHSFRAMNSDIDLIASGNGVASRLDRAERWLRAFESRFSRFNPASELSRLNAAAGKPVRVSPALLSLVQLSLRLSERSGGLFDPTVLRALEASGYDRSFDEVRRASISGARPGSSGLTWRDVKVDPLTRTVVMPHGSGLDLGGVGKGWAVDRMAAILRAPCLVNAGGDVFASGRPESGDSWLVGVEDPFEPRRDLVVLSVSDRGVATSSSLRRRWFDGRRWSHHLIDPRTAEPTVSDAVQVTVVAQSAALADYHAKVALLLGVEAGLLYLDSELAVEGLIVDANRNVRVSAGLESLTVGASAAAVPVA